MTGPVLSYLEPRDLETGPRPQSADDFIHWTLTRDDDDIAWAVLDKQDSNANTLSQPVMEEFSHLLDRIEQNPPRALVLRSAKNSGFLAGADINEFQWAKDEAAVRTRISEAHAVVDRLEALPCPTIAVMHGYAMGGGLEIGLACTHRIAVEGVRLGLPEVKVGLHPGLGGTARLTRQIDPLQAMTFMLTGKTIHTRQAKRLGLVDAVMPERHVRAAVRAAASGNLKRAKPAALNKIKNTAPVRKFVAGRMRAKTEEKARRVDYPAPHALIDLWEMHGGDAESMRRAEIRSFASLMTGRTAQNLIRVFFLREKLKGLAGKAPSNIRHVHVIGAGVMGGDIAAWCAWKGIRASLTDVKPDSIGNAIGRAAKLYSKIGRGDGPRIRDALDLLTPDPDGDGVETVDLVIEAAPEKLDLKRKLYAEIEPRMKPDAILATNTSAIALGDLCRDLKRPDQFLAIHFFNPVSRLDLVEIGRHDGLDAAIETRARAFAGELGKLPAPARSAPGFIVNRALTPYLIEAMAMLDEGVARETIDKAATDFGMPMGPLELIDQVGLDVGLSVAETLKKELGWAAPDAPDWLRLKVEAGDLGKKAGKGIYNWKNGEPVKSSKFPRPGPDMADRLILPMVNETLALLREGVTDDPDIADAAMIFGAGFAPFRGGPVHYALSRGVEDVRAALTRLEEKHGERFRPDPGWDRLV